MSQSSPPTHSPKYRPDIDGLRALAVLAVVGFHAFPEVFPGGFIGVDVFFVISGYLISSLLLAELEQGRFQILDFYSRRIKRIFPALLLTLVAVLGLGWAFLMADEYQQLGKHVAGGAGFVANLVLWSESGYFDTAAEVKPLLHLWSLGIEEQFYIVWPLLLWVSWKRRWNFLIVTILAFGLSFLGNIWWIQHDAVATFYAPQTRFWEILSGSLLACFGSRLNQVSSKVREGMSGLGLVLLGVGFAWITKGQSFPGVAALLPVGGAVLLIAGGKETWINRQLFSRRFMVWFGLISFPLYLWHWPLFSFARILFGEQPPENIRGILVVLSILLAWLTYRFYEVPLRFRVHARALVPTLALLMFVTALAGYVVYERQGMVQRNVVSRNTLMTSHWAGGFHRVEQHSCSEDTQTGKSSGFLCMKDSSEEPRYALVGDSKAGSLHTGLVRTSLPGARWMFLGGGDQGIFIPALTDKAPDSRVHLPYSQQILSFLLEKTRVDTVLIASATRVLFGLSTDTTIEPMKDVTDYEPMKLGIGRFVEALVKSGKRVVFLVDNPTLLDPKSCINRQTGVVWIDRFFPKKLPEGCEVRLSQHLTYTQGYRKMLADLERQFEGHFTVFDPLPLLCEVEQDRCPMIKNNRVLYSYTDHISDYAGGMVGSEINRFLSNGHGAK